MTAQIFDNEQRSLPNGGVTVTPVSETKDAVGKLQQVGNLLKETSEQSNGHGYPVEVRILMADLDDYRSNFQILHYTLRYERFLYIVV